MTVHIITLTAGDGDTDTILSPEFVAAYQTPRRSNMKFLINTLEGETKELELRDIQAVYWGSEVMDVHNQLYRLSTARSLEAEALKEATAIIRNFVFEDLLDVNEWERVQAWLAKWGRE